MRIGGGGPSHEEGSAIVGVMAVALVAAVVVASVAVRLDASTTASRMHVAREQALLLAELATEDALQRLAGDPSLLATGLGPTAGPVRLLSGAIDSELGTGVYTVDVVGPGPLLRVVAQGTTGPVTRAVATEARPRTAADLLWMVDRDVVDPALLGLPRSACDHPRQSGLRDVGCRDVAYGASDRFDGPFHSNDVLLLDGAAEFRSTVSSAAAHVEADGSVTTVPTGAGASTAISTSPFGLMHASAVRLPPRAADALKGEPPTCRFRGPTLLRFDGSVVRITSPLSVPQPGDGASGPAGIGCMGVDLSALASPTAVVLPPSATIEIVDADGCNAHPLGIEVQEDDDRVWRCDAGDAFVWGRYLGARTVLAAGSVMLLWDVEPGTSTAAADPTLTDAMLGLVATDSIVLRRPVGPALAVVAPYGRNLPVAGPDVAPFGAYPADAPTPEPALWDAPRVVASLVALRGGFGIQNPFRGEEHLGAVEVTGSVAQRFHGLFRWEITNRRGAVVARTGYDLDLTYDRRLTGSTPPALPVTREGGVRILRMEEVDPAAAMPMVRP
jgi:hypothetical protein